MRMSLAAVLVSAFLMNNAQAVEFGPIEKAHEAYNKAAASLDSNSRMSLIKCSADKAMVCDLKLNGRPIAMASTNTEDHKTATDITIMHGSGSDPVAFTETVIISMVAWAPDASKDERAKAFSILLRGLKTNKTVKAKLGDTTYKLMPLGMAGVAFIVE